MTLDEIPNAPPKEEEPERETIEQSYIEAVELLMESLELMEISVKNIPKWSQTGTAKTHVRNLRKNVNDIKLFIDLMS